MIFKTLRGSNSIEFPMNNSNLEFIQKKNVNLVGKEKCISRKKLNTDFGNIHLIIDTLQFAKNIYIQIGSTDKQVENSALK